MTMSQAEAPRMSLLEATNIGNQLLAMGHITREQLALAIAEQKRLHAANERIRLGDILVSLGFVDREELEEAFERQCRARDVKPTNQGECEDALKILRQTANAFHRSTESRLRAYSSKGSGHNGHSLGVHLHGVLNGHEPND